MRAELMTHKRILLFLFLLIYRGKSQRACDPADPKTKEYGFCNTSLSARQRADDLVMRLTLPEKIKQLSTAAEGIARLGIPPYQWWSESLHGMATNGPGVRFNGTIKAATMFPQVIHMAASFNYSLWSLVASAVAVEARAMFNENQAGLTFWAPNINIFRDPRWGRGQETPGEDPFVASRYAVSYVTAFQSMSSAGTLMLSACCKHFTAYDLDLWNGFSRYNFNAVVTRQDLEDTFQPPFRSCIEEGQASCLMCSYNQINGVPSCAHYDLISQKARAEWGFQGYVPSDCDAVAIIYDDQNYTETPEDAVAAVLKAGMDINCGTYLLRHTLAAIEKGKVDVSTLDGALVNLFSVQMRLGLFDGDIKNANYSNLGPTDVCTDKHRQLALEAARQGVVLLKNKGNTLPLIKSQIASLAVIGPNADNPEESVGAYSGVPCKVITPLAGLAEYTSKILYSSGCDFVNCTSRIGFESAKGIAATADAVVIVAGLDSTQEKEDHDRIDLVLPGEQQSLVSEVAHASKGPVILVIMSGGPVDVSFAVDDSRISAILWVGYPGEVGGKALAEVIFGDYNPGGRLPMTWYPQDFIKVPMNIMNMRPDPSIRYPGRTYRFYTGPAVFPFGHGLSYSRYTQHITSTVGQIAISASKDRLSPITGKSDNISHIVIDGKTEICPKRMINIKVVVHNHGPRDGEHVVLLYVRFPGLHKGAPQKQLIGFTRVYVKCGKSVEVEFTISPCLHLSMVTEDGTRILSFGQYVFMTEDAELTVGLLQETNDGKVH
eukprot:TRINITY_DN1034_c0_g1_i7.p1 TRINITY_DN1034_c0_g1~~TRINITY_DN1034_c0_g1_i7.p1  ORF type:complete len:775 (+),score=109.88 TRINITY_DN1034_c0_g1_i7:213-2537(+)